MKAVARFFFFSLASAAAICASAKAEEQPNPFARIGHIVVIYTENRSFDHVFGMFPGAEGLMSPSAKIPQVDVGGGPLPYLPMPSKLPGSPAQPPNAPFPLDDILAGEPEPIDPTHDFYQQREQINDGKMDRFVEASNAGGLVMGYFEGRNLRQWQLAKEFALADHFFHAAFGGSMLNHFFLVCACAPRYPDAPQTMVAMLDDSGRLLREAASPPSVMIGPPNWLRSGKVTPDGYVYGKFLPHAPIAPMETRPEGEVLPAQTAPTIGEKLDEKGVSWAWYAGGWNDVVTGRLRPYAKPESFQTHHQPFVYFAAYAPGGKARDEHLKDLADFLKAADEGTLPQVSFYKPIGRVNSHPQYSKFLESDAHIGEIVDRLRKSPNWADMLIIVTADENGGYWDHVAPPKGDRFGPGARVPTIIVSPHARKGFIDQTVYDTTSILRTIEVRFGLAPLAERDAAAKDLRNALTSEP